MTKVFLSTVSAALADVRLDAVAVLRTAEYDVINMEAFGARPERPLDVCLKEMRRSDVAVVVIGPRYGSLVPESEISYTQAEFLEARRRGIPVLAFSIPPSPDCGPEERSNLQRFKTEAGESLLYVETVTEKLVAAILASLAGARNRGEVGASYRAIQPAEPFFGAQRLHNLGDFVGRERELAQLEDFLRSDRPLLAVIAAGGSGKSRLLLELSRRAAAATRAPTILAVDAGAAWDSDDIKALPVTPTILIVDDGHRRPDLDRLIAAARIHNPSVRFLVSCRPAAVDIVRPHLTDLLEAGGPLPALYLADLSREASLQLAKGCLGRAFEHLAERLVRVAHSNPLVVTVGGRCVQRHEIAPELLDHSPVEFRTDVLERLLSAPGLPEDKPVYRRILEVLAVIGPTDVDTNRTRQQCAEFLGIKEWEIARLIGDLERWGLVQRRGSF